jgi:formylglycine-generating enzyme required for sulfatase activity
MKKLLIIATLALLGMAAFGQQAQRKLLVTPFENRGAQLDTAALDNLQDYLINAFINTGRFQVPDRNALALLAAEQKFQLSDWADDAKSAQMGKVLTADYIVRVIVMHDGEYNLLTARILDVNTTNGLAAAEMEFITQREARGKMDDFVSGILTRISGGRWTEPEPPPELAPPPPPPPAASPPPPPPPPPPQDAPGGVPEGFVLVEGGTFTMGSPAKEPDRDRDEGPQHQVTVQSFYMGKYEVTQREWQELMGTTVAQQRNMAQQAANASGWQLYGEGDLYPMYYVSWHEAIEYCNKRSVKEGLTPVYRGFGNSISCDWSANGYRLPTEAEWEYAAKGGNKNFLTYLYAGSNSADAVAWYEGNSEKMTHVVGTKAANDLGIYDLSGNMWEWCWDWKGNYGSGAQTDPAGPSSGTNRVMRGGSWSSGTRDLRSSSRNDSIPSYRGSARGFRLVRTR